MRDRGPASTLVVLALGVALEPARLTAGQAPSSASRQRRPGPFALHWVLMKRVASFEPPKGTPRASGSHRRGVPVTDPTPPAQGLRVPEVASAKGVDMSYRTRIVGLLRRALPAAILLLPLLVAACGPGGSHY